MTNTAIAAVASPIAANCRGVSTSWPTSAMTPAIAVPACAGPPFRNARTWSRRASGTTFDQRLPGRGGDALEPDPSTNRSDHERHEPRARRAGSRTTRRTAAAARASSPPCRTGRSSRLVDEDRDEERGAGHRGPEQPEEPGQRVRVREPLGGRRSRTAGTASRTGPRTARRQRHPHEQRASARTYRTRRSGRATARSAAAPAPADPWLRDVARPPTAPRGRARTRPRARPPRPGAGSPAPITRGERAGEQTADAPTRGSRRRRTAGTVASRGACR